MAYALEVRGVSLRFGGVRALTEVSFGVNDGELFSIIGPNGAGKTSIVNCISGRYQPTEGQLFYRGARHHRLEAATRAAARHRPHLPEPRAVPPHERARQHHGRAPSSAEEQFPHGIAVLAHGARREELAHRRKVEEIIDFLELQSVRKATAGTLPYGLRKRVELARAWRWSRS